MTSQVDDVYTNFITIQSESKKDSTVKSRETILNHYKIRWNPVLNTFIAGFNHIDNIYIYYLDLVYSRIQCGWVS
jgi:hypothetical protein